MAYATTGAAKVLIPTPSRLSEIPYSTNGAVTGEDLAIHLLDGGHLGISLSGPLSVFRSYGALMENLKQIAAFFQPDPRSDALVAIDANGVRTMALDDQYVAVANVELHAGVPEDVRSYMETVKTLYLYGWLYYPFYTLAHFLSCTAVEMALHLRFEAKYANEKCKPALWRLLQDADDANLLSDGGFPTLPAAQALMQEIGESLNAQLATPERYVDVLKKSLPKIRNAFAHPKNHTILMPGMALSGMIRSAEIINQLWPDKPSTAP